MVFSQNLLYACTMKTIPAIETNRPTKKYRERKQECSLPRAKSPSHSSTATVEEIPQLPKLRADNGQTAPYPVVGRSGV
jgi:hypothetical protein